MSRRTIVDNHNLKTLFSTGREGDLNRRIIKFNGIYTESVDMYLLQWGFTCLVSHFRRKHIGNAFLDGIIFVTCSTIEGTTNNLFPFIIAYI